MVCGVYIYGEWCVYIYIYHMVSGVYIYMCLYHMESFLLVALCLHGVVWRPPLSVVPSPGWG